MLRISATVPCTAPPAWAVLQRRLFALMSESVHPFLEKYTRDDGEYIWDDEWGGGSPDDFYEGVYNWPLLYLLGGGDHLADLAERQWQAITRQLTRLGTVHKDYARSEDQFHQGESDIFFYLMCLAAPRASANKERARRFAGLYMNEDPEAINYDPERKLILGPCNGSGGPAPGFSGGEASYGWSPNMCRYGLPHYDVPGIESVEDLKDPAQARRMGATMVERMSTGDVVSNLAVTSLVTNAFLLTGEEKYRDWVLEYTDAWFRRAEANQGLLPDNVGLSGAMGENIGGKWYGGLYGWTWPHGFYNIQMAATLAAANALLLTRDTRYLEVPRRQLERILELGEVRDLRGCDMSLREHWVGQYRALGDQHDTLVVPYRYGDAGWFDFQPISPVYPVALWNLSMEAGDWARIEEIRRLSQYDWNGVFSFRTKEDAGHEPPWVRYLAGENSDYPEQILGAAHDQVCRRLALIDQDQEAATHHNVHHWQSINPVTTEALIQLTTGAPQQIYNGGLLMARLRYFDAGRQRPGLPEDVAALVEKLGPEGAVLRLVNLSGLAGREVVVQAGAFREHTFTEVGYDARTSEYPGPVHAYASPDPQSETRTARVDGAQFSVELPPATQIVLDLGMQRFAREPSAHM